MKYISSKPCEGFPKTKQIMFLWATPTELRVELAITPSFTGGYSQATPTEFLKTGLLCNFLKLFFEGLHFSMLMDYGKKIYQG
jgi:hypothetical protein